MSAADVSVFGWIPFTVCMLLSLLFSTSYVLWHRSAQSELRCVTTTIVTIVSLAFTLLSASLIPVDVFLVSYMKNDDGTFKTWAQDVQDREDIMAKMMHVYYGFFGTVLVLAFIVLPLNFFYHATSPLADEIDDEDDDEIVAETFGKKMCRAFKYTTASIVLLLALILLGIFLPLETSPPPNDDIDEKINYMWMAFKANEGENMVVFLLNSVCVVGMFLVIIYTGYGMSSLPCAMIGGSSGVHDELAVVDARVEENQRQIEEMRNRDGVLNNFEQDTIMRLEKEVRLLQRTRHNLDQASKSLANRCVLICRPFQVVIGLIFGLFGFLIITSLLLTSIDKAMHSAGAKSGYILRNGSLPNPVDVVLVGAQKVFPIDYILYSGIVLFFVFSSMAGVKSVGIRFLWLPIYRIKSNGTRPQALSVMALTLILILVALNVVIFTLAPDYTSYGSQKFIMNGTGIESNGPGNADVVVDRCDDEHAPLNQCTPTRIAILMWAFHTHAWIFGAAYYWLTWIFILVVFGGSFISLFTCVRRRHGNVVGNDDEDELIDDASAT